MDPIEDLSIRAFMKDRINRLNAGAFAIMAIATSFTYYLVNFYVKYLPGFLEIFLPTRLSILYQNQFLMGAPDSFFYV